MHSRADQIDYVKAHASREAQRQHGQAIKQSSASARARAGERPESNYRATLGDGPRSKPPFVTGPAIRSGSAHSTARGGGPIRSVISRVPHHGELPKSKLRVAILRLRRHQFRVSLGRFSGSALPDNRSGRFRESLHRLLFSPPQSRMISRQQDFRNFHSRISWQRYEDFSNPPLKRHPRRLPSPSTPAQSHNRIGLKRPPRCAVGQK